MSDVEGPPGAPEAVAAWAASGAMALTGRAGGPPLGPPAPLVSGLQAVRARLVERSAQLGRAVAVDPLGLLAERAAIAGLTRRGRVSCGGGTQLLPARDGWLAVSLARDDDLDLLPAWLGVTADEFDDPWAAVADAVADRRAAAVADEAAHLGLPVSLLPDEVPAAPVAGELGALPCNAERLGDRPPRTSLDGVVVADLGALWAGPLCGSLLADGGATVVKVESTTRPDGARQGPVPFLDLLNAGKGSVALDLTDEVGRERLRQLLARVDVVVEGSRPRALEQLGIDAHELLGAGGPQAWVSITGHGRTGPGRDRVGFGDDAAVGGGLVVWEDDEPRFCADAVADPCTGLVAAAATLEALAAGGTWLLDVALAGVAASLAGPTLAVPDGIEAAAPVALRTRGVARPLGADNDEVFALLGVP